MHKIDQEIAGMFAKWNAAVETGDPEQIVRLYAKDAVLLPTMANTVRVGHEPIKDYFRGFLKLKPKGKILKRYITVLDQNNVADDGLYSFAIIKAGKHHTIHARYSFIYEKIKGKWMIKVHHSSQLPKKPHHHYSIFNPKRWILWLAAKVE